MFRTCQVVVGFVAVVFSAVAFAQGETKTVSPEKPISETKFIRSIDSWQNSVKLSGTDAQKSEQWKKHLADFNEKFRTAYVEVDGIVTNVSWQNNWITVSYKTRSPSAFRGVPVSLRRYIWIRGTEDVATSISTGDRFTVTMRLVFFHSTEGRPPGAAIYCEQTGVNGWEFDSKRHLNGAWLISSHSTQFGKEVYTYETKVSD